MTTLSTRERLLNASEELIAQHGFANTSLREITAKAEANLASVNYHFGSKEGIAKAVLERHLVPLNQQRIDLLQEELDAAKAENRLPDVKTVLRALIEPILLYIRTGERGRHFVRIFSRLHTDPDPVFRKLFIGNIKELFDKFYHTLTVAMPRLPKEIIFARMIFSFGAMGHAASMLTDERLLSDAAELGLPPIPDPEVLAEETIEYIVRGMETS